MITWRVYRNGCCDENGSPTKLLFELHYDKESDSVEFDGSKRKCGELGPLDMINDILVELGEEPNGWSAMPVFTRTETHRRSMLTGVGTGSGVDA